MPVFGLSFVIFLTKTINRNKIKYINFESEKYGKSFNCSDAICFGG